MMTALLMLLQPADAGTVFTEYCVRWDLDYNDETVGDFLTPGQAGATDKPARGVLLRFVRPDSTYFGYFMDWNGSDKGCKSVYMDDSIAYTVKVISWARVDGNDIEVVNSNGALLATTVEANHVPTTGSWPTFTVGSNRTYNILGAAAKALQRNNGGVSGETFRFVKEDCPNFAGTSCDRHIDSGEIFIDVANDHDASKFIVTHELGHALATVIDGSLEDLNDSGAYMNDCLREADGYYQRIAHYMNSKEFQSTAAVEGFAHYYAAISFNKHQNETDCSFYMRKIDWDLNGVDDDGTTVFSCANAGVPSALVDGYDFLEDYCLANGATTNRGVQYDWLRHFWSLTVDYDFSFQDIADIWDEADPNDWNYDDGGNSSDDPAARMADAAFTVGGQDMLDDYGTSADLNGTDR